jgi:RNA polymerase sigma-70 factor (ECF subfamily)
MNTRERPPEAATQVGPDFEAFFRDEHDRLYQSLFLVTCDRGEAEDLAQESLARAYERWDRIRSMESPAGYVYRMAFNLYRNRLRWRRVRSRRPVVAEPPVDPAAVAEARDEVRRALGSLPNTQRVALVLVEWLEMTADEAGAVLGIEGASVRGRVHRARATLRERFGRNDE